MRGLRINFRIPSDPLTWQEHIENACLSVERFAATTPLVLDQSHNDGFVALKDRAAFLAKKLKTRPRSLFLVNDVPSCATQNCYKHRGDTSISGSMGYHDSACYPLTVTLNLRPGQTHADFLCEIGDASAAFSAQYTPEPASEALRGFHAYWPGQSDADCYASARQLFQYLKEIGEELPDIEHSVGANPLDARQPLILGWLNYWSRETCDHLGFPDIERDHDLLQHSFRTPGGAWLVQLTEDPLDFGNPEHLRLYASVYRRYPKLGVRKMKASSAEPVYPMHGIFLREKVCANVVAEISALFGRSGYAPLSGDSDGSAVDIIRVALFSGEPGWICMTTDRPDFFSEYERGERSPRMVGLCRALECAGFKISAYSKSELVILEINRKGRVNVSGFRDPNSTGIPLPKFEARLRDKPSVPHFSMTREVELDMLNVDNCGQAAQGVFVQVAGHNAPSCELGPVPDAAVMRAAVTGRRTLMKFVRPI